MSRRIVVDVSHIDPIVAVGLSAALRKNPDFDVEERRSGAARRIEPLHVLVTDYDAGIGLLAEERARDTSSVPPPAVLVVTHRQREREVRRALEAGVRGYLPFGCAIDELDHAVRSLGAGMRHIGVDAARRLANSLAQEALTPREQQVLELVVEGMGNKAVARNLGVGTGTVKSHLRAIYGKLDANSRTEAVRVAERRGLFDSAPS